MPHIINEENTWNNSFMNTILLRIKMISSTLQCNKRKEQNILNTLNGEGVASFRCELWSEKKLCQRYVDVDNSFALNDFKQVTYRSNDLLLVINV